MQRRVGISRMDGDSPAIKHHNQKTSKGMCGFQKKPVERIIGYHSLFSTPVSESGCAPQDRARLTSWDTQAFELSSHGAALFVAARAHFPLRWRFSFFVSLSRVFAKSLDPRLWKTKHHSHAIVSVTCGIVRVGWYGSKGLHSADSQTFFPIPTTRSKFFDFYRVARLYRDLVWSINERTNLSAR